MKTNPLKKTSPFRAIALLPKLAVVSAIAFFIGAPNADARPRHPRGGGYGPQYSHHHHHHHGGYYGPQRPVHGGWSRPVYPPVRYVDHRYLYALPRGYRVVYRSGNPYYYANGCYYRAARYNNRGVYIQVNL